MENFVTLNKIIYRIWESLRAGIYNDDSLNDRIIENDIVNARGLLLRNELSKNRTIDVSIRQRISNIKVEETSNPNLYGYNKMYLKTKTTIPRTIERYHKPTITSITIANDSYNNIPLLDFNIVDLVGNGRFNTNKEFSFLHDEYLFIHNPTRSTASSYITYYKTTYTSLSALTADEINLDIEGVFQNPKDANVLLTNDDEYPLSTWMVDVIIGMILDKYLKVDVRALKDTTNDNNLKLEATNG